MHKEEVHKNVSRLSGGSTAGSKEYLSFYQKALTQLCSKVPETEMTQAKERAKVWNNTGPPPELQAKWVLTCLRWLGNSDRP